MKYYMLKEDMSIADRWHLSEVLSESGEAYNFCTGRPLADVDRLFTHVSHPGPALDYFETSFGVPIACKRLARAIEVLAPDDVQFIPLEFRGQGDGYLALNVIRVVDGLDVLRSKGHWREEGRFSSMHVVAMFGDRIPSDAHLFAPFGYRIGIVVSAAMRAVFLEQGVVGARFDEVIIN